MIYLAIAVYIAVALAWGAVILKNEVPRDEVIGGFAGAFGLVMGMTWPFTGLAYLFAAACNWLQSRRD